MEAKVFYQGHYIRKIELSFAVYHILSVKQARVLLVELVEDFLQRINSDPGMKEKGLISDHFIAKQLTYSFEAKNCFSQDIEMVNARLTTLDDGIVTYVTFPSMPEIWGKKYTYHETYPYALMLAGKAPSFDQVISEDEQKVPRPPRHKRGPPFPDDINDFPEERRPIYDEDEPHHYVHGPIENPPLSSIPDMAPILIPKVIVLEQLNQMGPAGPAPSQKEMPSKMKQEALPAGSKPQVKINPAATPAIQMLPPPPVETEIPQSPEVPQKMQPQEQPVVQQGMQQGVQQIAPQVEKPEVPVQQEVPVNQAAPDNQAAPQTQAQRKFLLELTPKLPPAQESPQKPEPNPVPATPSVEKPALPTSSSGPTGTIPEQYESPSTTEPKPTPFPANAPAIQTPQTLPGNIPQPANAPHASVPNSALVPNAAPNGSSKGLPVDTSFPTALPSEPEKSSVQAPTSLPSIEAQAFELPAPVISESEKSDLLTLLQLQENQDQEQQKAKALQDFKELVETEIAENKDSEKNALPAEDEAQNTSPLSRFVQQAASEKIDDSLFNAESDVTLVADSDEKATDAKKEVLPKIDEQIQLSNIPEGSLDQVPYLVRNNDIAVNAPGLFVEVVPESVSRAIETLQDAPDAEVLQKEPELAPESAQVISLEEAPSPSQELTDEQNQDSAVPQDLEKQTDDAPQAEGIFLIQNAPEDVASRKELEPPFMLPTSEEAEESSREDVFNLSEELAEVNDSEQDIDEENDLEMKADAPANLKTSEISQNAPDDVLPRKDQEPELAPTTPEGEQVISQEEPQNVMPEPQENYEQDTNVQNVSDRDADVAPQPEAIATIQNAPDDVAPRRNQEPALAPTTPEDAQTIVVEQLPETIEVIQSDANVNTAKVDPELPLVVAIESTREDAASGDSAATSKESNVEVDEVKMQSKPLLDYYSPENSSSYLSLPTFVPYQLDVPLDDLADDDDLFDEDAFLDDDDSLLSFLKEEGIQVFNPSEIEAPMTADQGQKEESVSQGSESSFALKSLPENLITQEELVEHSFLRESPNTSLSQVLHEEFNTSQEPSDVTSTGFQLESIIPEMTVSDDEPKTVVADAVFEVKTKPEELASNNIADVQESENVFVLIPNAQPESVTRHEETAYESFLREPEGLIQHEESNAVDVPSEGGALSGDVSQNDVSPDVPATVAESDNLPLISNELAVDEKEQKDSSDDQESKQDEHAPYFDPLQNMRSHDVLFQMEEMVERDTPVPPNFPYIEEDKSKQAPQILALQDGSELAAVSDSSVGFVSQVDQDSSKTLEKKDDQISSDEKQDETEKAKDETASSSSETEQSPTEQSPTEQSPTEQSQNFVHQISESVKEAFGSFFSLFTPSQSEPSFQIEPELAVNRDEKAVDSSQEKEQAENADQQVLAQKQAQEQVQAQDHNEADEQQKEFVK